MANTILLLAREHLPRVAELERICFAEPWSEQALAMLTADGGFGVVIVSDGQVSAYGGMTYVLDEGSVTNIAVSPSHRGQGLGRRVVQALLAESLSRDLATVFLEVRESNEVARHLYESEGFSVCGVRKNFYRQPVESAIQMVWRK